MTTLQIAIIGAGPAGLSLARLLQNANIPCHIFDLDAGPSFRDQGGTVDLHARGGQIVLKEAGLLDEFKKHARPEGECSKLVKFDGTVIVDENVEGNSRPAESAGRPEIDRNRLRSMLLESLKPETVSWGQKLLSVEELLAGGLRYRLIFDGGREEHFDVVIGADGAWSKVRPFLTETKPFYSSVTAVELCVTNVTDKKPWLSSYVGAGSVFMFDEGRAIICQRNGDDSIRTFAAVRQPETWSKDCGIDWTDPNTARKELVERHFSDCGEDLKRVVLESDGQLRVRPLYMLPVGMSWESRPGVSLIGDAAHLMTPFAGVGVNVAMMDALDLAKAIIASNGDVGQLGSLMVAFEAEMFKRGEMFAKKTWKNLESHFSATGGEERARLIKPQ